MAGERAQPSLRRSRERLASLEARWSDRGESCAYPKLSDSRPTARRAPVVPRVAAHVPRREADNRLPEQLVRPAGMRVAAGGRDVCEGRSMGGCGRLRRIRAGGKKGARSAIRGD